MNSDTIDDVCSGDGATGHMYGACCSKKLCGRAMMHVPMHRTFFDASSSANAGLCAGPPTTAKTPAAAALSASARAATSSVLAPVPSMRMSSILRP